VLIVEVLSPSTRWEDLGPKLKSLPMAELYRDVFAA
jgi:hypothetical protein